MKGAIQNASARIKTNWGPWREWTLSPKGTYPTNFLKVLPEELPAWAPDAVPEVMLDVEEASEDGSSGDTAQEPKEK